MFDSDVSLEREYDESFILGSLVENAFGPRAHIDSWWVGNPQVSPISSMWAWVKHGIPNVRFSQTSYTFCKFNHWPMLGSFSDMRLSIIGRERRGLPTSILPSCPTWCKEYSEQGKWILQCWKTGRYSKDISKVPAKIWPWPQPRLPTSFWRWRHGDICWATSLGLPWTSASRPRVFHGFHGSGDLQ